MAPPGRAAGETLATTCDETASQAEHKGEMGSPLGMQLASCAMDPTPGKNFSLDGYGSSSQSLMTQQDKCKSAIGGK